MQYNLSKFPVGENDAQLKDENMNLVTYREILMTCVSSDRQGDGSPVQGPGKFIRYQIWKKLKKEKQTINLTAEEVALLKDACQVFPVIVMGQVVEFLEAPEKDVVAG